MKLTILFLAAGLLIPRPADAGELPDPVRTPGATNPDVNQENIEDTICVPGYTKTIRPPASYTNRLKLRQLRGRGNPADFEEDHLIPLSSGGHPLDPRNLWPQPRAGEYTAADKDACELATQKAICAHKITLETAQRGIAANWISWCHYLGAME